MSSSTRSANIAAEAQHIDASYIIDADDIFVNVPGVAALSAWVATTRQRSTPETRAVWFERFSDTVAVVRNARCNWNELYASIVVLYAVT